MLVSELRETLKKYNKDDLKILIVEMYKSTPKKLREEKGIDFLVLDVKKAKQSRKRKKVKVINFYSLEAEIELFIEDAYNQYYFAPNSYVHKKDRPKWRFKVKRFIKDLNMISIDTDEGKLATKLLGRIYKMLCYGCSYYIFRTEDTFNSVGIGQIQLTEMIMDREFGNGINAEIIRSMIELIVESEAPSEYSRFAMIRKIINYLKVPETKKMAIEQSKIVRNAIISEKKKSNVRKSSLSEYRYESQLNCLTRFIFILFLKLFEYENGISYFKKHFISYDKECSLYVLLSEISNYDLDEYWKLEYKKALKKGIEPRDSLKENYEKLKLIE